MKRKTLHSRILYGTILLYLLAGCRKEEKFDNSPDIRNTTKNAARVGTQGVLFSAFTPKTSSATARSTIYRSPNGNSVGSVIYQDQNSSAYFVQPTVTSGDFDGNGDEEFISTFNSPEGPRIYRNEDGNSIGGQGGALIYQGNPGWRIEGVATADMNGDGVAELYISQYKPEEYTSRIFKSDGYTFVQYYYQPGDRQHTALAGGDTNGDGIGELYLAQFRQNSGGVELYRIRETSGVFNVNTVYSLPTTSLTISALTCGDLDNNGLDELYIGINYPNGSAAIFRNQTITGLGNNIYTSGSFWRVAALAAGDVDGDNQDELISGFNSSAEPRIYRSEDGTSIGGPSGGISFPLPASLSIQSITVSDF